MLDVECPPTWPDGAKLVIVGDAPGREEIAWSRCPRCTNEQDGGGQCRECHQAITEPAPRIGVGASGRLLQRACRCAELPWESLALTTIAKRPAAKPSAFEYTFYETVEEPIYTKTGKLSKRTKRIVRKTGELQRWEDELRRELRSYSPNLVVATGNHALEALVGHAGVANYRGSILASQIERSDGSPFKVLCVEHPRFIVNGNLTDFWILAHDLKKAKREAEFADIRRTPFTAISDPQHCLDFLLNALRYVGQHPEAKWTLDVETRAGTLACYSIAYRQVDGLYSFCVPLQTTSGPYWSPDDECLIWRELHEAAAANPNLCNQNIEYDLFYLLRHGVEPAGVLVDTMLLHSIMYPEFPKGLDFLASFYLDDVVFWKNDARDWTSGTHDQDLWSYNCKDSVYTLRIVEKQIEEAQRKGIWEMYHGHAL